MPVLSPELVGIIALGVSTLTLGYMVSKDLRSELSSQRSDLRSELSSQMKEIAVQFSRLEAKLDVVVELKGKVDVLQDIVCGLKGAALSTGKEQQQ